MNAQVTTPVVSLGPLRLLSDHPARPRFPLQSPALAHHRCKKKSTRARLSACGNLSLEFQSAGFLALGSKNF